ncbi:hypothetical protein AAG906_039413 [Vitis piasezkii]
MLRLWNRSRTSLLRFSIPRPFSSSPNNSIECPNHLNQSHQVPPPPPILHHLNPLSPLPTTLSRPSLLAVSATLISAVIATCALVSVPTDDESKSGPRHLYADFEQAIDKSNDSLKRIVNRMKQTGVAASVLWQSLTSVLSSANYEVRSGFELKVAALLADIAAANASRRQAIVGAGGGKVLDWLLETVAVSGDNAGTQGESARALAHLLGDPNVCEAVLGRPDAVPNLLRFIFSSQPQTSKKHARRSSLDVSDSLKGRSMLVAAIMDIVTSNCDSLEKVSFQPSLPGNAKMRDIAAAIEVIEDGSMHFDEPHVNAESDDGGKGMRGIGIKILGGTTVLGLSRTHGLMKLEHSDANHLESNRYDPKTHLLQKNHAGSLAQANLSSSVPGLWDDLRSQHVAVPFAAWALANWARASEVNRTHIQELDQDGHAVMAALMAPERTVKWHGSLVARLLLEDNNLPLNDSVSDWSSSLLSTVSQASKTEDISLAQVALSAFLLSVEKSVGAQKVVMEKGLHLMRETAKSTTKHKHVQEALAKALELLCTGKMHLSFEESQMCHKILSCILEDYGPSALPVSQGWLAMLLTEILGSHKQSVKGSAPPKSDKVKALLLRDDYEQLAAIETYDASRVMETQERVSSVPGESHVSDINDPSSVRVPCTAHIRRHAARLLTILSVLPKVQKAIVVDENWCKWLEECANGSIPGCHDFKIQSYARATLLNVFCTDQTNVNAGNDKFPDTDIMNQNRICPRYDDMIFLINPELPHWNCYKKVDSDTVQRMPTEKPKSDDKSSSSDDDSIDGNGRPLTTVSNNGNLSTSTHGSDSYSSSESPPLDVVFVHGLRGGPFKTWRITEDKSSTQSGLVEKIDQEAGKQGTFWPREWLAAEFPHARLFSLKYKTNLTQWSGASLPLLEVSSMLLDKLVAAGIGNRPVVFVTHSMGGLVVKQMLYQAKAENIDNLVKNTIGIVFYSCPHFGSKLADMPWRMGFVFRPAPTIGELRSGSPRLVELNDFIRHLHKKKQLEVLSFSETKVTPIVEGYGGWAFRMEIVPIESAYPGFGELISADHINSCKPVNRTDPSYTVTLDFLRKLKAQLTP